MQYLPDCLSAPCVIFHAPCRRYLPDHFSIPLLAAIERTHQLGELLESAKRFNTLQLAPSYLPYSKGAPLCPAASFMGLEGLCQWQHQSGNAGVAGPVICFAPGRDVMQMQM